MVGPLQARPQRAVSVQRQRFTLGAEIELFTPVGLTTGDLGSGTVVPAKVRRIDHADGGLFVLGQGEELPGVILHLLEQVAVDAMAGEIEKADVTRGVTQVFKKFITLLRGAFEQRKVQRRQRGDIEGMRHDSLPCEPNLKSL